MLKSGRRSRDWMRARQEYYDKRTGQKSKSVKKCNNYSGIVRFFDTGRFLPGDFFQKRPKIALNSEKACLGCKNKKVIVLKRREKEYSKMKNTTERSF